jgi:hypothetical protein
MALLTLYNFSQSKGEFEHNYTEQEDIYLKKKKKALYEDSYVSAHSRK